MAIAKKSSTKRNDGKDEIFDVGKIVLIIGKLTIKRDYAERIV